MPVGRWTSLTAVSLFVDVLPARSARLHQVHSQIFIVYFYLLRRHKSWYHLQKRKAVCLNFLAEKGDILTNL